MKTLCNIPKECYTFHFNTCLYEYLENNLRIEYLKILMVYVFGNLYTVDKFAEGMLMILDRGEVYIQITMIVVVEHQQIICVLVTAVACAVVSCN